ncbi:DUF2071 domain-containing protein [Fulvivirgaceae bacterium PWU4]|uniref:DUF2071 domain-containing protein n=1 Tax=Chryseosolibacter histidini TaxID=2782349 RepID=A0AAP2DGQ5_9BACT|nr:DUF2071 domain-containing protein [Chryseosolibacter histidini]MBT1696061.1 DUF2071 domain-containing protein [Chryseosolibacter histidini]
MLNFLKDHPFAVASHFETSLVLTYAVPKEELQKFIPECLLLDTFEDTWAFIAVAMVKTRHLRPKGFPKFIGNDFVLTGYRIFVQYHTSYGKRLRGLYIIRSETDKPKMTFLGNIFTHYKYQKTDIAFERQNGIITVQSAKSNLFVKVKESSHEIGLPEHSPFRDWKEARRFAGPLPFTFTYNPNKKEVLVIEGVREEWIPQPVEVIEGRTGFIDDLGLKSAVLANAFVISNIPYYWKKGRKDPWKP